MVTAATKLIGLPVVIGVGNTLPVPVYQLEGLADFSGLSFELKLSDFAGVVTTITGVGDYPDVSFPLTTTHTALPIFWRGYVTVTHTGGDTYTLPAPPIAVVDYAALWASPAEVAAIADEDLSIEELVLGILAAEGAVRAWVSKSITSPVSERVRRAVALLAARALTTSSEGSIVSEQMGDYQVRYASPQQAGLVIDGEVERLLGPWSKGKAYSVFIGPNDQTTTFFESPLYSELP